MSEDALCYGIVLVFIIIAGFIGYTEMIMEYHIFTDTVIYKESETHFVKVYYHNYYVYTKDCYKFEVSEEFYNHINKGDVVEICKSTESNRVFLNTTSYGQFERVGVV